MLETVGQLRLLQGKTQEALEVFKKIEFDPFRLMGVAMGEHTLGRAQPSRQALDALIGKYAQVGAYQIAEVFAWRGEKDPALEWLERAYNQKDGGLVQIKCDNLFESLRADARFKAVLRKMKLPE